MNQTKLDPPKKELRPHVSQAESTCSGKTPCDRKCALDGRHRHRFHTCAEKECAKCHADERFRRAAA
jgi:hypothetical protein